VQALIDSSIAAVTLPQGGTVVQGELVDHDVESTIS
jgi:hypothetical protein